MKTPKSTSVDPVCDNRSMADIVVAAKDLDVNSKIELFNYMATIGINYMENANGVFFSLTNLSDETLADVKRKLTELKSYEEMSNQPFTNSKFSEDAMDAGGYASDKSDSYLSGQRSHRGDDGLVPTVDANELVEREMFDPAKVRKNESEAHRLSFECDEEILKSVERCVNKNTKKNIHSKYSIAKKKYNKPFVSVDTKKIDGTDLSELSKELYIVT